MIESNMREIGETETNQKLKRSYSLDFLKILATIGIVFHHFQQITGAHYNGMNFWGEWFYWGYLVEFFFILSGYFVHRYIAMFLNKGMTLSNWWCKRAKRLLPMVAISAVIYEFILIAHLKVFGNVPLDIPPTIWGTVIASLGIQEGWMFGNPCVNNPIWYISVLMACYIWFYILTMLAGKIKCNPMYLYIVMIILGVGIQTYEINLPLLNSQMARGYYAFFFGLLLAMYVQKIGVHKKEIIASLVCVAFLTFVFVRFPTYGQSNLNYLLTFLLFPALILLFETKLVKRAFSHKIWGELSKISFEVYLWHNPLLLLMNVLIGCCGWSLEFSKVSSMFVFLAVCWAVGAIMYYAVERPISTRITAKQPAAELEAQSANTV